MVVDVVDDSLSPDVPLGGSLGLFVAREDAERLIEGVGLCCRLHGGQHE